MKIWKKYLVLSRIQQIAIAVCLVHLLAIFAMTAHHFATRRLRPAKPIAVRTLPPQKAAPSFSAPAVKPAPAPAQKTAQKPEQTRPKKPEQAKPEQIKQEPAKIAAKKPAPAKTVPKASLKQEKPIPEKTIQEELVQNEALQEIAKSLQSLAAAAAITAAPEPRFERPALIMPKAIAPSQTNVEPESNVYPSYEDYLVAFLQGSLDLPERGDVRIRIEIDHFGHLSNCEILDMKNSKNGEFLKKRLPELAYPCFNDFGITDLTQTFTITFRNVETR